MGEGFPLWSLAPMAWEGREPLQDWICLSVSLCFCALPAALSPFRIYMEIRNSDWGESFAQIFLVKLAFLRQKKSVNRLTGAPGESRVRPTPWGVPLPCGPLGHHLALILFPQIHIYSKKNLRKFLSRLDSI